MSYDSDAADLHDRLAEALGGQAYNRLVESVSEVRRRGRLRFWQERLLEQVADRIGVVIPNAEDFLRVFDGATRREIPAEPLTREVFLREIEAWPYSVFPFDETPGEWMAAAWGIDRVREELSGAMARTVGKTGELAYTDEYLGFLSRSLPLSAQIDLFLYIRTRCSLREAEFRPGFERAFPQAVPLLPPPLTPRQLADDLGITEEEFLRGFSPKDIEPPNSDGRESGAGESVPF